MTEKLPKTIQFFLPEGEPRGIRIAEITTRIVQAVLVPRNKLPEAGNRPELKGVGVYFLFGQPEDAAKPMVYVGEAEDCYTRLKQQNAEKEFWQQAIAVVSRTGSFTKAHGRYLEWYCIKKAKEVGRYAVENATDASEPFVTEPMRADLMDAFDTLNILTSALGFPVVEARPKADKADLFFCTRKPRDGVECDGKGYLSDDGFTVFAGSRGRKKMAPYAGDWLKTTRRELVEAGIIAEDADGKHITFQEDYTFRTPSGAAEMLIGSKANGWTEWKSKFGGTLDELKRREGAGDTAVEDE